jgi:hypothetical protein
MESLCTVTRERLSFFAGKYNIHTSDAGRSFPFILCHQFSPVFHAGCQVFREWWASIFLGLDVIFWVVLCIYFFAGRTSLGLLLSID